VIITTSQRRRINRTRKEMLLMRTWHV